MPALTSNFVFNMESKVRVITENKYANLIKNMWWDKVARVHPTDAGRDILTFILSTAQIDKTGLDPSIQYRPVTVINTEVVPKYLSTGLELQRAWLEDTDGNGLEMLAKWASDVTYAAAYSPQQFTTEFLKDGYTAQYAYDSKLFFSKAHPLNPRDVSKGTYANVFTGNSSSADSADANSALYPGAIDCVLTSSNTVDTIFTNLQKAFAYIGSIRMPNGIYPRKLKPKTILAPSKPFPGLQAVLDAKFISMASAGSGGGSTSIEGTLAKLGYGDVIHAPDFDVYDSTSVYIVCESAAEDQLGAVIYSEREPVGIRFFTGEGGGNINIDSILSENDTLKYNARGRAEVAGGEPSVIFQLRQS